MSKATKGRAPRKEREVGSRFATMGETVTGWKVYIHELTVDESGQQWNTLVGILSSTDENHASAIARWIR